jgi:hypothetical protein
MEAPYIYAAMDALAARATAWAERRQRLLLEGTPPDAAAALQSPEEAGAAAAAAVKQVPCPTSTGLVDKCEGLEHHAAAMD